MAINIAMSLMQQYESDPDHVYLQEITTEDWVSIMQEYAPHALEGGLPRHEPTEDDVVRVLLLSKRKVEELAENRELSLGIREQYVNLMPDPFDKVLTLGGMIAECLFLAGDDEEDKDEMHLTAERLQETVDRVFNLIPDGNRKDAAAIFLDKIPEMAECERILDEEEPEGAPA